jgi:hypothetical protein
VFGLRSKGLSLVLSAFFISIYVVIPTPSSASNPCPNTDSFSGISNLTLWLRADCVTGNAADPADNSTVNTWTDLSGLGNNATRQSGTPTFQSDSSNLINSQPVVNFDGSSTFTSIDIRAITRPNVTIFTVYKLRSNNQVGIWGIDDGGWDRFFMARWNSNDGIISHSGTTTVPNSGVNDVAKNVTTIYKYNVSNGSTVYNNGALVSSFTDNAAESAAQTTLRIGSIGAIGGGFQLIGDVAEIIIFSQALSDADRKTVNGYLNNKYNLGMLAADIPVNLVFNSLTIGANASYRKPVTITATVSAAAKVTFRARNIIIPGCKNKSTSATSPFVATCTWKPSVRGSTTVTATAVLSSSGGTSTSATPITTSISNRTASRSNNL